MSPFVSIIVPVYNSEKYLRQCVNSVLAQTYSEWELILVDDGSTDSSFLICEEIARLSSQVKAIHKSNGGPSSARNAGIMKAKGEYITFLDSDDFIHPLFLELTVREALSTKADIVACNTKKFKEYTTILKYIAYTLKYACKLKSILLTPLQATRNALYQKKINASACGKLFKSSLWKYERFREDTNYEDLDVIPFVLLNSHLVALYPFHLYFYLQHNESFIHRFSMKRTDVLHVTDRLVAFMRNNHPDLLSAALDRRLSASFNIMSLIEANRKNFDSHNIEEAAIISDSCWIKIKELRAASLFDRNVRIKNKAGIIASYIGGRKLLSFLSTHFIQSSAN